MRKFGPLSNYNRISNRDAVALVLLVLGGNKRPIENQKLISSIKEIWPKIGHKTSSDHIDLLVNQLCTWSDIFETEYTKARAYGYKRKLTKLGVTKAREALMTLQPNIFTIKS